MAKNQPPINTTLSLADRQLLEQIGQQVIHKSRRKVLLSDKKKNVSKMLKEL